MLGLPALFLAASCSLVVDTEELQAGAAGLDCGEDAKVCPDRLALTRSVCVSKSNPSYGCASSKCGSCQLANATPRCDNDGNCAVASCLERYKDCNETADDGCEADLDRDERNCGSCDNECKAENGLTACSKGQCQIIYCSEPFANCDGRHSTGCETDLRTSLQHCGECDKPCSGTCEAGVCEP